MRNYANQKTMEHNFKMLRKKGKGHLEYYTKEKGHSNFK